METRDPKTGEIVRYNADDDTTTLGELLRQEKFGAGIADQKNLDIQFAQSIMTDGGFVVSALQSIRGASFLLLYVTPFRDGRTISITWTTMPRSWEDKRCVQML